MAILQTKALNNRNHHVCGIIFCSQELYFHIDYIAREGFLLNVIRFYYFRKKNLSV